MAIRNLERQIWLKAESKADEISLALVASHVDQKKENRAVSIARRAVGMEDISIRKYSLSSGEGRHLQISTCTLVVARRVIRIVK